MIPSRQRPEQDPVLHAFLTRQQEQGLELAANSDLLDLLPVDGPPARRYVASYRCKGFVRRPDGEIVTADRFRVGIAFPSDYLRHADSGRVLTWLGPAAAWHPNILPPTGWICAGRIAPGTSLVDLIYQCFEIVACHRVSTRDPLNPAACSWARRNRHRFPIDDRPLRRRSASRGGNP